MHVRILMAGMLGLFAVGALLAMPPSFGSAQTTTALGDGLNLETVTTAMSIPKDNTLPWGHVEGTVNNPAEGYPVIIQFYKDGVPVHFAQTDVGEDGSYDYKFRVRNMVDGQPVNVFEGNYTVMIFKVVYGGLNSA